MQAQHLREARELAGILQEKPFKPTNDPWKDRDLSRNSCTKQ